MALGSAFTTDCMPFRALMTVPSPSTSAPLTLSPLHPDYKQPPFFIDTVHLDFILNEDVTHVHSTLHLLPNYPEGTAAPPLVLNGRKDVKLVSIKVRGPGKASWTGPCRDQRVGYLGRI